MYNSKNMSVVEELNIAVNKPNKNTYHQKLNFSVHNMPDTWPSQIYMTTT